MVNYVRVTNLFQNFRDFYAKCYQKLRRSDIIKHGYNLTRQYSNTQTDKKQTRKNLYISNMTNSYTTDKQGASKYKKHKIIPSPILQLYQSHIHQVIISLFPYPHPFDGKGIHIQAKPPSTAYQNKISTATWPTTIKFGDAC